MGFPTCCVTRASRLTSLSLSSLFHKMGRTGFRARGGCEEAKETSLAWSAVCPPDTISYCSLCFLVLPTLLGSPPPQWPGAHHTQSVARSLPATIHLAASVWLPPVALCFRGPGLALPFGLTWGLPNLGSLS